MSEVTTSSPPEMRSTIIFLRDQCPRLLTCLSCWRNIDEPQYCEWTVQYGGTVSCWAIDGRQRPEQRLPLLKPSRPLGHWRFELYVEYLLKINLTQTARNKVMETSIFFVRQLIISPSEARVIYVYNNLLQYTRKHAIIPSPEAIFNWIPSYNWIEQQLLSSSILQIFCLN